MIRMPRAGFLDRVQTSMGQISRALATAEEQAVTGRRMNRPSDAPASVGEAERLHASIDDQDVWQSNADYATGVLETIDQALGSVTNILIRARELAVSGANEPTGTEGRAAQATEVESLMDAFRSAVNTSISGRYVFGGTAWDSPPFDATDTYVGTTDLPETRVGTDRWVQTGLDGSAVFQGPVDVLATLDSLATALNADDPAAVAATLADLDLATTTVVDARTEAGTHAATALDASSVAASIQVVFSDRLSSLISADPTETYTRLASLRSTYEAALQVAGSSTTRTLFDFLS